MQLYRATLLHTRATKLREKIAGVASVLAILLLYCGGARYRNKPTLEPIVMTLKGKEFQTCIDAFSGHLQSSIKSRKTK